MNLLIHMELCNVLVNAIIKNKNGIQNFSSKNEMDEVN